MKGKQNFIKINIVTLNLSSVLYGDGVLYVLQCVLYFLLWITVKKYESHFHKGPSPSLAIYFPFYHTQKLNSWRIINSSRQEVCLRRQLVITTVEQLKRASSKGSQELLSPECETVISVMQASQFVVCCIAALAN